MLKWIAKCPKCRESAVISSHCSHSPPLIWARHHAWLPAPSISRVSAVFADGVIMSTAILSVIVPPDGLSCLLPAATIPNIAIAVTKYEVEAKAA